METADGYREDMYASLLQVGVPLNAVTDPNAKLALTHLLSAGLKTHNVLKYGVSSPDFAQEHLRWMLFDLWAWQLDHVPETFELTWKDIMVAWWDAPIAGWGWTIQFIDFMRKAVWNEPMNIINQESFM